jgi:prolyl-tRNA editing enzyme YbaK/EbsC (Cys-tRNA(Pro) deacylase)
MTELPRSARRVQDWLTTANSSAQVVELPDTTRTAAEAAKACSCEVGQIAKSLVFVCEDGAAPVLVIASGTNRVDEKKLGDQLGSRLKRADADTVRELTGYAIGGVPPVAHENKLRVVLDQDLGRHEVIWAAAGTPRAVFRTTFAELCALTGGQVLKVC